MKPTTTDPVIEALLAGLRDGDPDAYERERMARHAKVRPLTPSRAPADVDDDGGLKGT